jgi:hypothetical protein
MPIKDNYFAERIGVTNFTIAQAGMEGKAICYISHYADLDKTSNVFCNYFYKFCFSDMCKDVQSIIIKLDNCRPQNKNNKLLSNFPLIVNESDFKPNSITLDYLVKGHTFQSADNIHALIEKNMRKNKIIYDFDNLIDIKCSRNNLSVIPIDSSDIYSFSDNFSYIFSDKSKKKKLFNMSDIKSVQFRKGSANAFVKCNYLEDNYKEVNRISDWGEF